MVYYPIQLNTFIGSFGRYSEYTLLSPFFLLYPKVTELAYIVYVLLGYILNEIKLSRVNKILIYIGALAGLLVHTIGTYYLSIKAGMIIETYKGYENLPCLVYSVGVYVLLQSIASKISSEKFWKVINFISGYTFPIYLMHIYVWRISTRLGIYSRSLTVRLLMPDLVMVICIIITYFLRKIPIIKHIVP